MSKVKDQVLRQQEKHIKYMGKFLDYIYDNVVCGNLSESDLDEMERSSSHSNSAIASLAKESLLVTIFVKS